MPPKLSARARVFATGQGRKTDATDAHSVALVGTRMAGLRPVVDDEQLAVLRVLVDRRRSLGEDHTRMIVPAAPPAARADPGRCEEGPVRRPGQGAAGQGPTPRRRRQDPAPGRRRADRRPRTDLCPQEGRRQGAQGAGRRDRHQPAGPARHRPVRRRPAAGRGRRHHPVPRPRPLRVLERHRPHRRLLRRPRPAPAVAGREPSDQPDPAHHGHRPATQPDRGTRLLRPPQGRRQDLDGSHALPETHGCPTSSTAPCSTTPSATHRQQRTGPGGQRGNDSDSSAAGSHPHTGSSDKPLPGPATNQA